VTIAGQTLDRRETATVSFESKKPASPSSKPCPTFQFSESSISPQIETRTPSLAPPQLHFLIYFWGIYTTLFSIKTEKLPYDVSSA
jgi:hypothetical protein